MLKVKDIRQSNVSKENYMQKMWKNRKKKYSEREIERWNVD